jgi:prepilin-type N-terminal cleavage/methylation domain-containing protein
MYPVRSQQDSPKGFTLIALLVVLVIIALLSYNQLVDKDGAVRSKQSTDRAKTAACATNRTVLRSQIAIWAMSNTGKPVTLEAMKASGVQVPGCPLGGEWSISPDGNTIYCSICDPQPAAEATKQSVPPAANGAPGLPQMPRIPSQPGLPD